MEYTKSLIRVAVVLALSRIPLATAAFIQVDSTLGSSDLNSCTLVDAFYASSHQAPFGTCAGGDGNDVIELPPNSTIVLTSASGDYGDSILAPVQHTLLIVGNGSAVSSIYTACDDSSPNHRLMSVWSAGILYINDLTLSNGCANDTDGGAINASGSLELENVTFLNNASTWNGGAVSAVGPFLQISNSSFRGNTAMLNGGAVRAGATQTIITGSYFSENSASNGGALIAGGLRFKVNNSTFVQNQAFAGGAIDAGSGTISFSTFVGNNASIGAAVSVDNAPPQVTVVTNSIFAKSPGGEPGLAYNCGTGFNGVVTFLHTNVSDDASCGGSVVVASQSAIAFGAPGLYGGTTLSLPLGMGSAAMGMAAPCEDADGMLEYTDQRGHIRNSYGICDVGAFEHDSTIYPAVIPAPLGAGNLLISNGINLSEYTRSGVLVRDFWPALQPPFPAFIEAVDGDGLTGFGAFFDGYNGNAFGRYSVADDIWMKATYPNWYDYNGGSVNKIAHIGRRWFMTAEVNNFESAVVVIEDGSEVGWLYPNSQILDLKMGLDGILYVLQGSSVQKFDPVRLSAAGSVDLSENLNQQSFSSIAVGYAGEMFLYRSDGDIVEVDAQGNFQKSTDCVVPGNAIPCINIREIALSQDHMLFLVPYVFSNPPYTAVITSIDDAFTAASSFPISLGYGGDNGYPMLVVSPLLPDRIFANGFDP
jgi:hypothetical protein